MAPSVLEVTYYVRSDARSIEERARAIAIEQSVEMPLAAIADEFVRAQIVGRVCAIEERSSGLFEVRIALAGATIGTDPGQLINMLFGNTSLHADVALHDVELPGELVATFARAIAAVERGEVAVVDVRVEPGYSAVTTAAMLRGTEKK